MLQNDVSTFIEGIHYLLEHEQYDALYKQLEFSITFLLEQQQLDDVMLVIDHVFPILLAQHKVSIVRQLLELMMPHIDNTHAYAYANMLYFFGHVYFVIEEAERAIHYYRQSISYFMLCEPIPFSLLSNALLHLALLTEETSSPHTQLSYARIISTFKSINIANETATHILNKYSFYYETCLRLAHFDDAQLILQQLQALSYEPFSREELQVHAFEVMYHYAQQHYEEAWHAVQFVLQRFSSQHNVTLILRMYTIAIDCCHQLQRLSDAMKLQREHDALKKHMQMQRMEVNKKFPFIAKTLPGSTPLPTISTYVNDALQQKSSCYTVIVYDVSTFELHKQAAMLQQLHTAMLHTFTQPIEYFTAITRNQCVYVLRCGAPRTWQRIEQMLATLPFQPTYGYCHSSKTTIQTFEQLFHMSFAYIYYAHSQNRKAK